MLDLTDWQNKKYTTRDGKPVRILCVDKKDKYYSIVGLISRDDSEEIETWTIDGHYTFTGGQDELDLINAKTKREGWVNVYPSGDGSCSAICTNAHTSKEEADACSGSKRLACVRIEWEE